MAKETGATGVKMKAKEGCYFESIDFEITDEKTNVVHIPIFDNNDSTKNKKQLYVLADSKKGQKITTKIKKERECREPKEHSKILVKTKSTEEKKEDEFSESKGVEIFYYDDKYINEFSKSKDFLYKMLELLILGPIGYYINKFLGKPLTSFFDASGYFDGIKYLDFWTLPEFNNGHPFYKENDTVFRSCKEYEHINIISYPNLKFDLAVNFDLGKFWSAINEKNKKDETKEDKESILENEKKRIERGIHEKVDNGAKERFKKEQESEKEKSDGQIAWDSGGLKFTVNYDEEEYAIVDVSEVKEFIEFVIDIFVQILNLLNKLSLVEGTIEKLNINFGYKNNYVVNEDHTKLGKEHNIHFGFDPLIEGKLTIHLLESLISVIPGGAIFAAISGLTKKVIKVFGQKDNADWFADLILDAKINLIDDLTWSTFKKAEIKMLPEAKAELEFKAGIVAKGWFGYMVASGIRAMNPVSPITDLSLDLQWSGKTSFTIAGGVCPSLVAMCLSFDGIQIKSKTEFVVDFYGVSFDVVAGINTSVNYVKEKFSSNNKKEEETGNNENEKKKKSWIEPCCVLKWELGKGFTSPSKNPTKSEGCNIRKFGLRTCNCVYDEERESFFEQLGRQLYTSSQNPFSVLNKS